MGFKLNSLILFVTSSITGGGAWLGYELSKPNTVKGWVEWKGFKLASTENKNLWDALYFQATSDLKEKIKDVEMLKQSCTEVWSKKDSYSNSDLDYVQKFCTDNLKSRKARIIADIGKDKFLSKDEDFKVAFITYRYNSDFLKFLGQEKTDRAPEIENNKDLLEKYKKYCQDQLDVNDSKITLLKQICVKRHNYERAFEKLKEEGLIWRELEDLKQDWKKYQIEGQPEKYLVNTLFDDISKDPKTWTELQSDQEKFGKKLEEWCNGQKDKKIYAEGFYEGDYRKFKARCWKTKEETQSSKEQGQ